jgi:hypothetical protein
MDTLEIEQRLAAVEIEIARLKARQEQTLEHPIRALEKLHGTFENDEAFQEAARLGRRWRQSQRPRRSNTKATGR